MAEQDFKQVVNDAILDADSLEKFINGSDSETVLTRLSAEYPTLQKALKELFENGGLPATPFATKALMTASVLVDGDYAVVTDDLGNNGLYLKRDGVWVRSKYDVGEIVYNNLLPTLFGITGGTRIESEFYIGRKVTPSSVPVRTGGVVGRDANFDTVMYDVDGISGVLISGADDSLQWEWIVTNAEMNARLLVPGVYGDGVIGIPDGAKWLIRTYQDKSTGVIESGVSVAKLYERSVKEVDDSLSNKPDSYIIKKELPINPTTGALVNNNRGSTNLFATGGVRQYLAYDVSDITELEITGAREHEGFEWVFSNSLELTANRHSFADFYGNGVLKIPDGVKYAVRSYYFEGNVNYPKQEENPDMIIKAARVGPTQEDWELIIDATTGFDALYEYAQETIKKSGLNIYKLSDFEGVDSHEKIDNAIEFIKLSGIGGILDLESGVHIRRSAILMPDNFWLYLNDSTLKLADGVHDNLIRNEGVVIPDDPFAFSPQLNENRNIRIFGNGKGRSILSGPDVPKTAPHPIDGGDPVPWVGDWYGWRTLEINLLNVKDYAIHGFSLLNSRCWGITQQHGCHNFEIHDIHFNNDVKNGDGIDILMGCKNFNIYNISGHTADDTVACSAVNEFVISLPYLRYIYPMMLGSWTDRGFGIDITDGRISNIVGAGNYHGLRLLESGGSQIKRISVNGVRDDINHPRKGYGEATVVCDTGYGRHATVGDISNITINNVESHRAKYSLKFRGPMADAIFNNITQHNEDRAAIAEQPNLAVFDNVKFTNITGSRIEI